MDEVGVRPAGSVRLLVELGVERGLDPVALLAPAGLSREALAAVASPVRVAV